MVGWVGGGWGVGGQGGDGGGGGGGGGAGGLPVGDEYNECYDERHRRDGEADVVDLSSDVIVQHVLLPIKRTAR